MSGGVEDGEGFAVELVGCEEEGEVVGGGGG